MHGRPRKAPKHEDSEASTRKAANLRTLQSQLLHNHHELIYSKEAIEISSKLLEINPESYTAWNYRKLAVEHHLNQSQTGSDSEAIKSILDEELRVVRYMLLIVLRQKAHLFVFTLTWFRNLMLRKVSGKRN